jgi:uncharacterized protein (DUF433 family)
MTTRDGLLERITVNPRVMVGKPVIKGTRLTVEYILRRLSQGATPDDLMREYDGLSRQDIAVCLAFAQGCKPSAPKGVPGKEPPEFSGVTSKEGARQMLAAIEEGCEKADDEW